MQITGMHLTKLAVGDRSMQIFFLYIFYLRTLFLITDMQYSYFVTFSGFILPFSLVLYLPLTQ